MGNLGLKVIGGGLLAIATLIGTTGHESIQRDNTSSAFVKGAAYIGFGIPTAIIGGAGLYALTRREYSENQQQ